MVVRVSTLSFVRSCKDIEQTGTGEVEMERVNVINTLSKVHEGHTVVHTTTCDSLGPKLRKRKKNLKSQIVTDRESKTGMNFC